jgi:hypothetical protein
MRAAARSLEPMTAARAIEDYVREDQRQINWVVLALFGVGGSVAALYLLTLPFRGLVSWSDTGTFLLFLLVAVAAAWIGITPVLGRKAAEERALAFFQRPPQDIVWIYVQTSRTTTSLVFAASDRTQQRVSIGGIYGRLVPESELAAILSDAARRWPDATIGFGERERADYEADPARLRRSARREA